MNKECWTCGHFLIGGGCWKDGQINQPGWKDVGPSDVCDEWVTEKTPGTINGDIWAQIEDEYDTE